jgi:class 3 adenylate cyclase
MVRYDPRGQGLSDREVEDTSLEAHLLDIAAVVDSLNLGAFGVLAAGGTGPIAIAYAARYPERVSHLVLWSTAARGSDLVDPRNEALAALAEADWEFYTEAMAYHNFGWAGGPDTRTFAAMQREFSSPAIVRRNLEVIRGFDATADLMGVKAPTLVVHRRQVSAPEERIVTALAAAIPGARLLLLEGSLPVPALGDIDEAAKVVRQFMTGSEPVTGRTVSELPSGTAVILFADIADSTALTERLGDDAFRAKARDLDGALRAAIRESGGTPVEGKLLGDGVLAVFTSAREAIEAALVCGKAGDDAGLPLHLGIHAGDVIREDNNVYGGAVNIASRIAGLSAAGEVLVSETVRSLARTSAGVGFEDRGEQELKGVGEGVRVWSVAAAANQQTDKSASQGGA